MEEELCMPVEYVYRRQPIPHSLRWHMVSSKASPAPEMLPPGRLGDPQESSDQVILTFGVPCPSNGVIVQEVADEYEDLADKWFQEIRPGHDLA